MNKLKEFFELVGVQPNVPFRLMTVKEVPVSGELHHFNDQGCLLNVCGNQCHKIPYIVRGQYSIVVEPFKPKNGEMFYYIRCNGSVNQTRFEPNRFISDVTCVASGNCFPTAYVSDEDYQRIKGVFSDVGVDVSEWPR